MTAAYVPMDMDQGEDWSVQLTVTDDFDQALDLVLPCRMDVKSSAGQTVLSLVTPDDPPDDGTVPPIGISSEIGLIQLYAASSQTKAISAGDYNYDLFVTVDDGDPYTGPQTIRLIYGTFSVHQRITQL